MAAIALEPPSLRCPPALDSEVDIETAKKPVCYLSLPLEIKHMILEYVFTNAIIMCGPLTTTTQRHITPLDPTILIPYPSFHYYRPITAITTHRAILLTCKQCFHESIALYYRKAELTVTGADPTSRTPNFLPSLPTTARLNTRTLSLTNFTPTRWLAAHPSLALKTTLPALRELHLPTLTFHHHCPHGWTTVHSVLRDFWELEGWTQGKEEFVRHMPAYGGVRVYQEVALEVGWCQPRANPMSRIALEVTLRVVAEFEVESGRIVETVPPTTGETTFDGLYKANWDSVRS